MDKYIIISNVVLNPLPSLAVCVLMEFLITHSSVIAHLLSVIANHQLEFPKRLSLIFAGLLQLAWTSAILISAGRTNNVT